MRRFLKDYFWFSRSERNGTLILALLMMAVLIFPEIYLVLRGPKVYPADPEFLQAITEFYGKDNPVKTSGMVNERFYEDAAGDTRKDGDQKIDQEVAGVFNADSANIVHTAGASGGFSETSQQQAALDINSADTTGLMSLRGIGPVLSRRIIRYRDILGGYYDVSQLAEVYGIDSEWVASSESLICTDTVTIRGLLLLSGEFGDLLRHPYLDYEQVSEIFRLRREGRLKSTGDLLESPLFNARELEKLIPYLRIE